jgi:hypothetical protein
VVGGGRGGGVGRRPPPARGAPPRGAGETDEFGFTVLQHGQTPAGWVKATVVFENGATGEALRVEAQPSGADGHFLATVRFPEAGYWSWRVELDQLDVQSQPRLLTVLTASGALPSLDPSSALALIEGAKADLRAEFSTAYASRIDRLEADLSAARAQVVGLERPRDALEARLAGGATGGLPVAAILAIAVLGGGVAGFVMAGLGRRPIRSIEEPATAHGFATTR